VADHDEDHVGPADELVKGDGVKCLPGRARDRRYVGIVVKDAGAALLEEVQDGGRRGVEGVGDVRLEGPADDPDDPADRRRRSLRASPTSSMTWRGIDRLMSPASSTNRSTKSNSGARHER
jgi:hypothetical protein